MSEAFAFLVDQTIPARNLLLEVLDTTVKDQEQTLTSSIDQGVVASSRATLRALLIMVLCVVLLMLGSVWLLAGQLRRRIAESRQVVQREARHRRATGATARGQSCGFSPVTLQKARQRSAQPSWRAPASIAAITRSVIAPFVARNAFTAFGTTSPGRRMLPWIE